MSKQSKTKLVTVYRACLITICGQNITEGPADRQKARLLYVAVRKYISNDRFNSDYGTELAKRKDLVDFYEILLPIDAEMKEMLMEEFPDI